MRQLLVFFVGIFFFRNIAYAQPPVQYSSSEIYHSLQKLNFLGTALYVAAHPDDENTRLISYLSNEVKARTAYLSLTRGDGGQNLIGPELRELLGVLRTQELLAARSVDGGEQFFSRANDFGYSKHPDETLEIWQKEEVLGDVVWAIRKFKPDVIINRFDHRSPGSTHGHHTSSAMLSHEAFDLANDPKAYPQQLKHTQAWQPKRLFFNTSWWFYGSQENFEKADKSNLLKLDIGVYYPILGKSNNEIAALASSQHLCQGFGRLSTRGTEDEYIELLKGDLPKDKNNIFDGIDTTWSRVEGGEAIGKILYDVEAHFNFKDPSAHLSQLLEAYDLLQNIKDAHWKNVKSKELRDLIAQISGLYFEASSQSESSNPGESVQLDIELVNRSKNTIKLVSVKVDPSGAQITPSISLGANQKKNFELEVKLPENAAFTSAYWLRDPGSLGMYKVDNPLLIGKPETPPALNAKFELDFDGQSIVFEKPVRYRFAKPDKGELFQPFEVLPKATASIADKVLIFADGDSKNIPVTVTTHASNVEGTIHLDASEGWNIEDSTQKFEILKKGDSQTFYFRVTPPSDENQGKLIPEVTVAGKTVSKELVTIDYSHVPKQSVLLPSEVKAVRLDIHKSGEHIGYITGAGDNVPESLRQIGYIVHTIAPETISSASLDKYDAVVVGIRAYNVVNELKFKQRYLFDYVENGGNLIIQYNTAGRWDKQFDQIAPYPITISRDRVTDENSAVTILEPKHDLVTTPNQINLNDFNGWVQERGLYFPNEWSKEFTPILSMKDKGESALKGSLLVAPYGKGHYIYTGLSFFRELPAGVPGAYKLFANMLSLGKSESTANQPEIKG
ncbi:MAG: LmbE family protein [Pseudozobellia sp.]|nr:LmbE family protein [Pseudozobellia sp.]MBG48535.1 LmbE family protein [Pseudozobellia sp.]MBG50588.1 LmbE family protein [Pseudozobellia sp.]|tara:strand:+ start:96105 stop:98642 length:2538 start_codon:yes stop_codon:yes gene_type:complete